MPLSIIMQILYFLFIFYILTMGNAVLMPQFYGYGIHKLPQQANSTLTKGSKGAVEVRKIVYRSTYDDFSESSIFSKDKNDSTFVQSLSKKQSKPSQAVIKTQQSFRSGMLEDSFSLRAEDNYKNVQLVPKKPQQESAAEDDPFLGQANTSIIDKVLQLEDTEIERQAIRQKCKILFEMGENSWKKGQFGKSIGYLQQVLRQSQAQYPDSDQEKAKLYSLLGSSYLRMGIYDKSADCYLKSLFLLQSNPKNIAKCANVHLTLGTIYQKTNYLDEAIQHLDASYALKKSQLQHNSPELLSVLTNLANLQVRRGNHIKAIQRYTQILAINRALYGSTHLQMAKTYYQLSLSLFAIRQYSMWLQYHYESIRMMKELQLQQLPDYSSCLTMFKEKLVQLIDIQQYAKDIVERSVHMALLLLNQDEQIDFLGRIKQSLEGSVVGQEN